MESRSKVNKFSLTSCQISPAALNWDSAVTVSDKLNITALRSTLQDQVLKFQQLNVIHVQKHIKLTHFNVWEHSAIIRFHKSVSASNLGKTNFYSLHLNIPHYSQLKLICLIMS